MCLYVAMCVHIILLILLQCNYNVEREHDCFHNIHICICTCEHMCTCACMTTPSSCDLIACYVLQLLIRYVATYVNAMLIIFLKSLELYLHCSVASYSMYAYLTACIVQIKLNYQKCLTTD